MSEWTVIITAKDRNQFICQIMKYALDIDPEVITIFFSKFELRNSTKQMKMDLQVSYNT